MLDLKSYFKPVGTMTSLRANQISCLDQISILFDKGVKRIEIEGPPGSGKSLIVYILMKYAASKCNNSLVCSPLNMQVDQYEKTRFPGLVTLKGREHYPCVSGAKNAKEGFCQDKKCPSGADRECKIRPYSKCRTCACKGCIYIQKKKQYRESELANTNLALYGLNITNDPGMVLIDEAGQLETKVRELNEINVPVLFKNIKFPQIIVDLQKYVDEQAFLLSQVDRTNLTASMIKELEVMENRIARITSLISDYGLYKEPWVITEKYLTGWTKFQPITVQRFLDDLFEDNVVILLSATPPGFKGFEKVVVDTVFPIESRQWEYHPEFGSMVSKMRDHTIPKLAKWLVKLQGKTVIQSRSYETGNKISNALLALNVHPLLQEQTKYNSLDQPRYTRYNIIEAFRASTNPDQICILTNQEEGLDLKEKDILNIVCFTPWCNNTNPIVKAKNELMGKDWQNKVMADILVQSMARIFRSGEPGEYKGIKRWKRGYICDSSFGKWYQQNKMVFPKAWREAEKL